MKQSIILKTIIILGTFIVSIFLASGYLFLQNDNKLINDIRKYNLDTTMQALDARLIERLSVNKKQMNDSINMISKNTSTFLLNFDSDGLKNSLDFDIKKDGVMGIEVWDSVVDENFLTALKNDDKISFKQSVPQHFKNYLKITKPVINLTDTSGETIGRVTLYYDETIIKEKINLLKENTKQEIANFNKQIDKEQKKSNMIKFYIALGTLFLILVLIAILLIKFVNKPLKRVQNGLDDFFLFLQNKKDNTQRINLKSDDEFGQMAQSLNENISVSAKLHEEIHELNTNLESRIEEKTAKVTTLLNNAGQGFLTFDIYFKVDEEYSKECEKLIGLDIASKDISKLLFKDKNKRELFKTSLINAINEKIDIKRNAYISLLPSIILLNKKAVKLEYKILEDSKFMMILTNITSQKKLERKVKKEQEILKMIVAVVSEPQIFYEVKKDFEDFIKNYKSLVEIKKTPLYNMTNMYRKIHTYKGTFAQIYMQDIVNFLHKIESDISNMQKETTKTNLDFINLLDSYDFDTSLDLSLSIIKEILGVEFLESDNYLKIDLDDISNLQEKIENILSNFEHTTPECKDILCQVQNLSSLKLNSLLHPFVNSTLQLANRLDKEIYPFEIIGDHKFVVSDRLKPFIKSLVHVFRNSVDHGIEIPDTRAELGKDELGTISCSYETSDENLNIIISDDGAGIDIEKLKEKLKSKNIDTQGLSTQEIYNYIFKDSFTTKKEVSETSGRGVGMSAVKNELDKLDGVVKINSQKDVGTTFEFSIPPDFAL